MCYINCLHHMPNDSIVKQVYNGLAKLHQLGFTTWVTHVSEMVDTYLLDIDCSPSVFKSECKRTVGNRFINMWTEQVQNIQSIPILRTYCNIKCNFGMETYLDGIKNYDIESLCRNWEPVRIPWQLIMEDTLVLKRKLKTVTVLLVIFSKMIYIFSSNVILIKQKEKMYSQNWHIAPNFIHMTDEEKIIFLIWNKDQQILTWVGKFIYRSFKCRAEYLL